MLNRDPGRGRKRKGGQKYTWRFVAENFPNLNKETEIQIQEAHRVPNKINPNRPTPKHYNKNGKI